EHRLTSVLSAPPLVGEQAGSFQCPLLLPSSSTLQPTITRKTNTDTDHRSSAESSNDVSAWWLIAFAVRQAIHRFVRLKRPHHPIVARPPTRNVSSLTDVCEADRRPSDGGGSRATM